MNRVVNLKKTLFKKKRTQKTKLTNKYKFSVLS